MFSYSQLNASQQPRQGVVPGIDPGMRMAGFEPASDMRGERRLAAQVQPVDLGHDLGGRPVMLRQIIDDCGHYEGLFLVARADRRLINDEVPKRALSQYTALKMRVWDDVRPLGRDNPLAPLVVLTP